jgi:hypothetical protein
MALSSSWNQDRGAGNAAEFKSSDDACTDNDIEANLVWVFQKGMLAPSHESIEFLLRD